MKPNVSTMRDWLFCPQYSYNHNVLRRGVGETSRALGCGTLFHECMEARLQGALILRDQQVPSWFDVNVGAREDFLKSKLLLCANSIELPSWDLIGTELVLSNDLGEGRLDALVKLHGKFYSVQWKTYSQDLLLLQEAVRLSWHEAWYQHLAEQNDYLPFGGTLLGACLKLPGHQITNEPVPGTAKTKRIKHIVTDEQRIAGFTLHQLPRSPEKQAEIVGQLLGNFCKMNDDFKAVAPPRNYDSCVSGRSFGRRKCQYHDVCHQGASLSDSPFIDIQSRYDEPEV